MDSYSFDKNNDLPSVKLDRHPTDNLCQHENDDKEEVYCLCRSSDITRFMIMCDNCEEWYHGDCINLTEDDARHIKYYYCKPCRVKDPFLKIKYRKSRKKSREMIKRKEEKKKAKNDKKNRHKQRQKEKDEAYTSSKPLKKKKDSSHSHESKSDKSQHSQIKLVSQLSVEDTKCEVQLTDCLSTSTKDKTEKFEEKRKQKQKKCGECINCKKAMDCGICDICRGKREGSEDPLALCHLRICLAPSSQSQDKKAEIKAEPKPVISQTKHVVKEEKPKEVSKPQEVSKPKKTKIKYEDFPEEFKIKKRRLRHFDKKKSNLRQCYGPSCIMPSRKDSKYCSDECGRRLAAKRLYELLPGRIQQWHSTPLVANVIGRSNLERIQADMIQAREELQVLETKFHKLESIIDLVKSFEIDSSAKAEDEDLDDDYPIYCVVCGHSVSLRTAIKHMDRCYIKIESQMSFGSVFPTRIEGSQRLFCDVYNPQQQTYCKRLQVLCPEHTKEPKIGPKEVCGCPLRSNIYDGDLPSTPSEFCRVAKRKCTRHYKWETMYRAEVDLTRIRQWLKIDEIFEEERKVRTAMSNRGHVTGLLLHQTINHDPLCTDMRTKPTDVKKPAYRFSI